MTLTDSGLIQALRICPSMKIIVNPNAGYVITVQDILDLINRQKAEIEEQDQAIIKALKYMGKIRSKAIKEFAERLKAQPIKCGLPLLGLQTKGEIEEYFDGIMMLVGEAIDHLVKEMTEGV